MGACECERQGIVFSDDEYLCQEVESQLQLKRVPFEAFREKLLGFTCNLSQSQLESFLQAIGIDLEMEYRNPLRPLKPFMEYFFDHSKSEYRKELLLSGALLLSPEDFIKKKNWLWWILEKRPGSIDYKQIEKLAVTFLEISIVLIPSLARRFDNGLGCDAKELETLKPVNDVDRYAKKLLTDLLVDESGVNEKITAEKYEQFMNNGKGNVLLSTTLLRRFVIKQIPPAAKN